MPSSQVLVREATAKDLDVVTDLNLAIARELSNLDLDVARLRQGVAAVLASREKGFYVVAEVDGKVVSVLMVRYEWSPRRNATFWWVDNVYVDPEWRRKGIYTAMLHYLESESKRTECACGIRLYTGLDNDPARRAYRGLGMKGTPSELFEIDYVL